MGALRGLRGGWPLLAAATLASACAKPAPQATTAPRSTSLFDRPWHWTDEQGTDFALSQWHGGRLVITAIFTSCTTRCPLTVEKLESLEGALRAQGKESRFALITLDPETDNVDRLRRFKQSRHLPEHWHVLRGSSVDTREFGRTLGVRAMRDDGHIDHDVRIAIFDSSGRLLDIFSDWNFDEQRVAAAM